LAPDRGAWLVRRARRRERADADVLAHVAAITERAEARAVTAVPV
jgi:hypothetical protein